MEKAKDISQSNPLVIARQGYFFVNGHYVTTPSGQFMVDQMYVEFQIPERQQHPYPIVLWHGGGQSGACFMGTPDGREGWAQFFLRRGYAVYVVDQPARGRSCYVPKEDHTIYVLDQAGRTRPSDKLDEYSLMSRKTTKSVEQRFTASAKSQLWPQAHLHNQWPGEGVVGDPIFDQFYAEQLPKLDSYPLMQSMNREAGKALLDRIGPAIILTHSESGAYGWLIADARPKLVKAIVAVEPAGPPVYDATYHKDRAFARPWGITAQPLTYTPALSSPDDLEFVEQEAPDAPGLLKCWLQKEPARVLTNLKHIPILIVTTEASYHASYDHGTARYLMQAGVKNTHLRLAEHGIHGNGHMMMVEKNSQEIAGMIATWLEENCGTGAGEMDSSHK